VSRSDSPLRDRVIFLVGARRSGTNWLERILTAHPEIEAMPSETYLFSHGVKPLVDRFQHANPALPTMGRTFMPREDFVDALRDLLDRAFEATLDRNRPDARYIVERTPWHASHLPLIAEVYPDARVINIVRDGRDVARSLISMPWGPETMAEAAAEWRDALEDARTGAERFGDRYRDVRYETLLQDPRTQLERLFDWLGLPLDDATWERILLEAGSTFNEDPTSPAIQAEKWREALSPDDLREFERVAGKQLEAEGYRRALPAESAPLSDAVRRTRALRVRHPREVLREVRNRSFAGRLHDGLIAHNEAVAEFERAVADGDDGAAAAVLHPRVLVRLSSGGPARELRGPEGAEALLRLLSEDRAARPLNGHYHASAGQLTTIVEYEAGDGSRRLRTCVYEARGGKLTGVSVYRFSLNGEPAR
jgi:hypothetical protein